MHRLRTLRTPGRAQRPQLCWYAGPNASVHAYAAAQVKAAMDATQRLGGENYVFWGGREGYHTLLNTDLKCGALHSRNALS